MIQNIHNARAFTRNDATSFYLLGCIVSDGWIQKDGKIGFCSADEIWIDALRQIMCPTISLWSRVNNKNYMLYRFAYKQPKVLKWLKKHGITTDKSYTLQFPKIPKKYILDFIRGCWDGDGCISMSVRRRPTKTKGIVYSIEPVCCISSGSKDFLIEMQKVLLSFGIKSSINNQKIDATRPIVGRIPKEVHTHYQLRINTREALKFAELIYMNDKLCLERKREKAKEIVEYYRSYDLQHLTPNS